jgi:hypothetical protein
VSAASIRSLKAIQQRASHTHLLKEMPRSPAPPLSSRRGHLDAIIVPASRPASFLEPAIALSALIGACLVVLCSMQTRAEQVARQVAKTRGARALIVPIPEMWKHPRFPTQTSAAEFHRASANRQSDLSAKRNAGLLLARLHGWNKIAFMDDDVTQTDNDDIARLAAQLEDHQVAGMVVLDAYDNSVVCHARRLAGFRQSVFVTGAVLGVNCGDLPLSFFPDIYNEDWFFFATEAATGTLPPVGHANQAEYDPFASSDRARREEFGDLLAEGLYALIGEMDSSVPFDHKLFAATAAYWTRFIDARRDVLSETVARLDGFLVRDPNNNQIACALNSLTVAASQLDTITPDLCVNFVHAWRDDLDDWQRFSNGISNVGSTREAMDFLQLKTWTLARFGAAVVETETGRG